MFTVSLSGALATQPVPGQWAAKSKPKAIGPLADTNELRLVIGLPLRNQDELDLLLKDLSTPGSPRYRQYLTPGQFAAKFGPDEKDYRAVITFARASGLAVTGTHPNRTLLDVRGAVPEVERAFHVKLRVFPHPSEKRTFYAPDRAPTVALAVPLLGLEGLDDYARPQPSFREMPPPGNAKAYPKVGSGREGTYMGNDFRAAYAPGVTLKGNGEKVGLVQFDGYSLSDITAYLNKAGLATVPVVNVLLDGFDGTPSGNGGEVEACIDIELAISMAPSLAAVLVYSAGPGGHYVDVLNRMATDNQARQLSTSWFSRTLGPSPIADQIFRQMAVQGQSFFVASGDSDAYTGDIYFPGESPYVTVVGGTALATTGTNMAWASEVAWNSGNGDGTGGGISTHYPIPDYQTNISMDLNQGSHTMRNIPDVSMVASNIYIIAQGREHRMGGTSCSAPLWAGFTALANQKALQRGAPIGFMNAALARVAHSSYGACFHDIVTGNNTWNGSPYQFSAVPGYDLCTGWGTPVGQKLIDALSMPDLLLVSPGTRLAFSGPQEGALLQPVSRWRSPTPGLAPCPGPSSTPRLGLPSRGREESSPGSIGPPISA